MMHIARSSARMTPEASLPFYTSVLSSHHSGGFLDIVVANTDIQR